MITLPKRKGEYVVYENARTNDRYHVEWSDQRGLGPASQQVRMYGLENITQGASLCPRTKAGLERFMDANSLVEVTDDRYIDILNRIERL